MTATTTTYLRCCTALLTVLPFVAACGGGENSSRATGARFDPSADTRLVITTDNGLRLRPADGERVTVDRHVARDWSHRGDTWVLDLSCTAHDDCPRMPEVDVPPGTSVTVSARNAGVDATGVAGALDLTTVNGDVTVTRSGRDDATVRLTTRNGSIRATDLRADRLHAETVNGDVTLGCATAPTAVAATTTNGSVRTVVPHDAPAYRVMATTDNGRPHVGLPTGDGDHEMTLTTVNGDVTAVRD